MLPLEVGVPRLGPPEPQPPRAPGPLALSEPDYIDEILTGAGLPTCASNGSTLICRAPAARAKKPS